MTTGTFQRSTVYRAAIGTAWVAGVFIVCVAAGMLYQRFTASSSDPWKSPQLLELKVQLQESPKNEAIKERIRELDLKFRERYFRRLVLGSTGGWLLLGGAIVLVLALRSAAEARKQPPMPQADREAGARAMRESARARRAVAFCGGVVVTTMAALGFGIRSALDDSPTGDSQLASAGPVLPPLPSNAEFLKNWPRFRGPLGGGVAVDANAPLTWNGATGAGIAWKSPVPAPGFNSPIVWGDRVFLSGATEEKREVFCYDAGSGRLLWQRAIEKAAGSPSEQPHISEETGFAASTMATDGRHAYAIFANGDLAAVTFDGNVAWSKHIAVPKNPYGHATSLAVWEGRVIVQMDQGESQPQNSRLMVFDGATGRTVWEKARPMPSSWATPIVIEASGQTQVITLGAPFVISYAFADGRELWRSEILGGEVTPSPIFADGKVLVIYPDNNLAALGTDGAGDITEKPPLWKVDDHIPDVTSPASNGELVFTVTSRGTIACFDAKAGKLLWDHELQTDAHASPTIAGNRLYITCTNGTTVVAETARTFKELARNELGEKVFASAAVVNGRIYVRGEHNLYCLTAAPSQPAP